MEKQQWDFIIEEKTSLFDLHLKELWQYRNLVRLFTKRNFITRYKQTILGPLWILINPLLSTAMFTIVFGRIARLPTEGVPDFIFYMAGNILWNFFSASVQAVSGTFLSSANLFGKVWFPRLTVPLSGILTNFCNFLIQFGLFGGLLLWLMARGNEVRPGPAMLLVPLLLVQVALLSLGLGCLIASVTAKYRDLAVLVSFGLQLWMYASPVVYPASMVPQAFAGIYFFNPMAAILESFRYAFLGSGSLPVGFLALGMAETLVLLLLGLIVFQRVERTFLDTV